MQRVHVSPPPPPPPLYPPPVRKAWPKSGNGEIVNRVVKWLTVSLVVLFCLVVTANQTVELLQHFGVMKGGK